MLAKVSWRLLKEPNGLWGSIYKSKYFPESSLLNINYKCGDKDSWIWKNLMRELGKIRENMEWRVGDGKTIRV